MGTSGWFLLGGFFVFLAALVSLAVTLRPAAETVAVAEGYADSVDEYTKTARQLNNQLQIGGTDPIYTKAALTPAQIKLLNQAIAQPASLLVPTPPADYSPLFVENPKVAFTRKDNETCRKATHPNQLPSSSSKIRCGWWYVDDPSTPSVGALGTYEGPMFKDTVPNGGVWMWDLIEAGKKEDLKRCKRLRACAFVDAYNEMPGVRCGFCPALGYGVPINGAGGLLYPDDSGCDEVVARADQCPPPDDGGGGGVVGQSNGAPRVVGICALNESGFLSSECAIFIAKLVGMSPQGGFIRSQSSGVTPPEVTKAYEILGSYIPTMAWWKDTGLMIRWLWMATQAQRTGPTNAIRNAAITLATGTPVDYCPSDPAVKGPFDLECMQQLFRQKGCQPAGKRYPVQQDAINTSMKSWGDLDAEYTGIQSGMASKEKTSQDKAVSDCLGIAVSRDRAPCTPPALPSGANNPTLEGFANPTMGTTFSLQLVNFPDRSIQTPAVGGQVTAELYPSLQSRSLEWKPGVKEDTIRISPKGSPNVVFRHRGFVVHADPYNPGDALLGLDSSFYVRPGNSDANQVSFESVNFPGRFLRHAGFRLFLHPKDGSALFNADSTFQTIAEITTEPMTSQKSTVEPMAVQKKVNRAFFKDRSGRGWRRLLNPLPDKLNTISIGKDGVLCGTTPQGAVFFKQSADVPWGTAYMSSMKSVDCASRSQVIGTTFDGSLYRYGNNTWTKLPFQNVFHASVSGDGSLAFMTRVSDNVFNSQYSVNDKTTVWGGFVKWLSLGPLTSDIAVLNTDGTTTVFRNNPEGQRTRRDVRPPVDAATKAVVPLDKVFMSKSSNKEVMALSTTGRLFGLDVDQKWSELPNPKGVVWAGLNAERIVGCSAFSAGGEAWTKMIQNDVAMKVGFDLGGNDIRQIRGPIGSSTPAACAEECRKDSSCSEWTSVNNYPPFGSDMCFLKRAGGTFTPHPFGSRIASGKINRTALEPTSFTVVANTVMGGTRTVPYTNKGLEQLKKECGETPGCVGFNYSATRKEGTFVFGNETGAIPAGALDGIHIGKSVPIRTTVPLPTGERVYVIEDGIYTKMVSTSGVSKYYTGLSSAFDPSRWNTYTNNPGNYIAMAPPQEYAYYRKT